MIMRASRNYSFYDMVLNLIVLTANEEEALKR